MNIEVTHDLEHLKEIKMALIKNGGYCPCQIKKTEDTKCMCKHFKEEVPVGEWCICEIYKKLED